MQLNAGSKVGLLVLAVSLVVATLCITTDRYHVVYTVYTAQPDGSYFEHQRSVTVYAHYVPNEFDLAYDDANDNSKLSVDSISIDAFLCNRDRLDVVEQ